MSIITTANQNLRVNLPKNQPHYSNNLQPFRGKLKLNTRA
ncbi:hypothetical protein PALI_a0246 [Pseudoalteromonas aliena SW19]|uniref:Transposase n=1 Tax=Pseudoalteromonas aliena SW19 TaxID=1314866 RepID=A0ABR9DXS2_9GAMM|nr:hypothetical protein [Pseudoalteromonas aliena SW19]